MEHQIHAELLGSNKTLDFNVNAVSSCPLCNAGYYPNIQYAFCHLIKESLSEKSYRIFVLYFCPNCERAFLSRFHSSVYGGSYEQNAKHISTAPVSISKPIIDKALQNLSPGFYKMYTQAAQADAENMTELAAIGYRCALEFLVKDYLLHLNSDSSEEDQQKIKNNTLSSAIHDLNDDEIESLARSIAWIGNDYAHYTPKHPEKDIDDLKRFFKVAINHVILKLTIEEAKDFVKEK